MDINFLSEISRIAYLLKHRLSYLPRPVLDRYLRSLLSRREAFLRGAEQLGTPVYVLDEPAVREALSRFQAAFSRELPRVRLFYAIKSNPYPGLSRLVVQAGGGLDVSSGPELQQALDQGCQAIVFNGPGKTPEELGLALCHRDRVTVILDSRGELHTLARLAAREGTDQPVRVGIRAANPHHGNWRKFGVPIETLGSLFREAATLPGVDPCGIHFHTSWNFHPEAQVAMIEAISARIRVDLPQDLWSRLRFFDLGGGFWPEQGDWVNPENLFPDEAVERLGPYLRPLSSRWHRAARPLPEFARRIGETLLRQGPPLADAEVYLEPGRWISHPSMHLLLRVVDCKDEQTVIVDGGINMLGWERPMEEFTPLVNLTRPSLFERRCQVFGPLCTPLDFWGRSYFGDALRPGDVLMVPDQGAYTYTLRQAFIKAIPEVVHYRDGELVRPEVRADQGLAFSSGPPAS